MSCWSTVRPNLCSFPPWHCSAWTCVPLMENRSVLPQYAVSVIWRAFSELKGRYSGYPLKMEKNGQVRFSVGNTHSWDVGSFQRIIQNCLNFTDTLDFWEGCGVVTNDCCLQIQIGTTKTLRFSFSFHWNSASRTAEIALELCRASRAAVVTYLNWLMPLKFLFCFDIDVVCSIV